MMKECCLTWIPSSLLFGWCSFMFVGFSSTVGSQGGRREVGAMRLPQGRRNPSPLDWTYTHTNTVTLILKVSTLTELLLPPLTLTATHTREVPSWGGAPAPLHDKYSH